jgi:hypothetical protein
MPRTAAQRRAQRLASARFYETNKDIVNRRRFLNRVAKGKTTRIGRYVLRQYGLTMEQINEVRRCNGLDPLPGPEDIRLPGCDAMLPATPPPSPNGAEPEPEPESGSCSMQVDDGPGPRATPVPGALLKMSEILPKIKALAGQPSRDKHGNLVPGKTLADRTAALYASGFERLAKLLDCDMDNLAACLNDAQKVADVIEREFSNPSTRKTYFNYLVAPTKYIPELKEAIGTQLAAIQQRMQLHIRAAEARAEGAVETAPVPALDSIKARVPAVKQRFGAESGEYLAALLQTSLKGLRGELGSVRVVRTERAGQRYKNFFVRPTGKLVIKDFKTKNSFPPYNFSLPAGLREEIEVSLRASPRSYLIKATKMSGSEYGALLKAALGAGVNDVRHSMVSHLLRQPEYASPRAREELANAFKHSTAMQARYWRDNVVQDD